MAKKSRDQLRVLVAGHAGLNKRQVVSSLADYIRQTNANLNVRIYDLEQNLNIPTFFKSLAAEDQQERWHKCLGEFGEIWREDSKHVDIAFLPLHLTYLWQSHLYSPLAWKVREKGRWIDLIAELKKVFQPQYCVTLIDDVQSVQKRIKGHSIRLRDLLRWRNVEVMMGDVVSKYAVPSEFSKADAGRYDRSPVVSVRHSPAMLSRYLLKSSTPRIYASYPISYPREISDPNQRIDVVRELDSFCDLLAERSIAFNPVTIDEVPVVFAFRRYQEGASKSGAVFVAAADQWDIPTSKTLCEEPRGDCELVAEQVEEVATPFSGSEKCEIERHVERRDYRMIDQSDGVVVYRPTYGGKVWSRGVYHEVLYALQTLKPVLVIHDPKNDGPLNMGTLGIELSPGDHFDRVSNLHDHENQRVAVQWAVDEIAKRIASVTNLRAKNDFRSPHRA